MYKIEVPILNLIIFNLNCLHYMRDPYKLGKLSSLNEYEFKK